MDPTILNGIVFCTVNVILFFAGTFLNMIVVLSIWKSTQLRKKLCYFTIFLLSCFDLVTVFFTHPFLIFWYIVWYLENNHPFSPRFFLYYSIGVTVVGSSLLVLLTMTLERYLGLAYPLLHKTSVTKKRLAIFLFAIQALDFISDMFNIIFKISSLDRPYTITILCILLVSLAVLNCRIFCIAKSRQRAILPNGRKGIMEYKKHFTCVLVVVWFFIGCSFIIIYYGLTLLNLLEPRSKFAMCLLFWAITMITTTSTINTVIFFWVNKVLRSEGQKLLKGCGLFRS